ncbi:hypothetical protein GDN83_20975 [Gordonia jinghuaiqii]|uniref:Glycine zipper family protein n=2 Tax=Gordonia jinghuaiqii TaxID=2758710 RepID=A0A7D7LZK4_9ACTN|nr:hypothetical protein [Gordonia jinghuaiqii]QMT03699.1 hypothetical protein H1R19_02400 [Gordonia jinghuaiqii]
MAMSITAGAGVAFAVPEQGGTDPGDSAPGQGGTSPSDVAPGSAGPDATVAPIVVPGPGSVPGPPVEAPYRAYTAPESQGYEQPYTPLINNRAAPRVAPPVRPIAPPPDKIRVGNFVSDIPEGLSTKDVNSINAWSAYGEAKIAQGLLSLGVPEDEASRRAAATIIGVMAGGTAGAVALGIPSAVIGAVGGAGVGAAIGAAVPPMLLHTGTGALIGAAVGGAGAGAAGAVVGFAIGGTAGGLVAYALGAGDPGANPVEPWRQNGPRHAAPDVDGSHQFEFHLSPEEARRSGLPAVDYVVNHRGDVGVTVGASAFTWSGAQARSPYAVFGPQAEKSVRDWTRAQSDGLKNAIPGSEVLWPAEESAR